MEKIIDFKSVSPLFEMERDGSKPFTTRMIMNEPKHKTLSRWRPSYKWGIRITNPVTGESFIRELRSIDYLQYDIDQYIYNWRMIILGDLIDARPK